MNFFYPLPNQGTLASGYGRLPAVRARDPEPAARRPSHRPRGHEERLDLPPRELPGAATPTPSIFEAGNALTNLPNLDTKLDTASVIAGWTKIFSSNMVNEFRVGYNYDKSNRQSNFTAAEVSCAARPRERAEPRERARSASRLRVLGRRPPSRPTNIADAASNVDRTVTPELVLDQRQPELDHGRALLEGGRPLEPEHRARRLRHRRQLPRPATASTPPRPATPSATSCWASRATCATRSAIAATLDGSLERLRGLRPGRLEGQPRPDRVPRPPLRDRGRCGTRRTTLSPTSSPEDGGYHVVPNDQVAALLPPGLIALDRTRDGRPGGRRRTPHQHGQEQLQPARRFRLANRQRQQDRAPRRLRPLPPHRGRPGRARPARHQRVPLRPDAARGRPAQRLLRRQRPSPTRPTSATRASIPTSRPGHLPVQPDPGAGAAGRHRRAPQLHRLDHARAPGRSGLQHPARRAPVHFDPDDRPGAAAPLPATATTPTTSRTGAAGSSTPPRSSCCAASRTASP